jgi:murein DD-endopeptidase MepM/ murein hydrolase activator NlpD
VKILAHLRSGGRPLIIALAVGGLILPLSNAEPASCANRCSDLWEWPIDPPVVKRYAEIPEQNWKTGHRGIDLLSAADGAVHSPADGYISAINSFGTKHIVSVTHGELRSTFESVTTTLKINDPVQRGQIIGYLHETSDHCLPDLCLHWGVKRGETYLDPINFVQGEPVLLE